MRIFHYLYFRCYTFYRDRLHAFDPHTYASAIPMLIQISILITILYLLNYFSIVNLVISNGWVTGGIALVIYSLNDRYFKGRFQEFEKRWRHEEKRGKVIRGYFLFFTSLAFFLNIFFIATKFHKLL